MAKIASLKVLDDGLSEQAANALFDKIEAFAGYAFNRSHAVEYSIISYMAMWLKVYYPAEFFAASMTILDEEKLPGLVKDAEVHGIAIYPPNVNISTGTFEVAKDAAGDDILYAPFNRVKGCSENTERFIIEGRQKAGGKFKSFIDFFDNVNKTRVNRRVQEALDRVGAFADLEFGTAEQMRHAKEFPQVTLRQLPARHPDRVRHQKTLLPGLINEAVKAERDIVRTPFVEAKLASLRGEVMNCQNCSLAGQEHLGFRIGQKPKIMIVTDAPNYMEDEAGELMKGAAANVIKSALKVNNLSVRNCYFTTLVKTRKPKGQKFFENDQISACAHFLEREIELLKPPIIVALGSAVARHLIKGLKGSINELNGTVYYDSTLDANIVVGLSPMQVHMSPELQPKLEEVFAMVAEQI